MGGSSWAFVFLLCVACAVVAVHADVAEVDAHGSSADALDQLREALATQTQLVDDLTKQLAEAEERAMEAEEATDAVSRHFERRVTSLQTELEDTKARLDEQLVLSRQTEERCVGLFSCRVAAAAPHQPLLTGFTNCKQSVTVHPSRRRMAPATVPGIVRAQHLTQRLHAMKSCGAFPRLVRRTTVWRDTIKWPVVLTASNVRVLCWRGLAATKLSDCFKQSRRASVVYSTTTRILRTTGRKRLASTAAVASVSPLSTWTWHSGIEMSACTSKLWGASIRRCASCLVALVCQGTQRERSRCQFTLGPILRWDKQHGQW